MASAARTALALALAAAPAAAQEVELLPNPTRWRGSVEWVEAREGDGFVATGLHYDFLDPFEGLPGVYVGVGAYGALGDDRGGWLTGGLTIGWRRALAERLWLDAGVYAGGSLNDVGASEEGLVARPHVALEWPLDDVGSLRLEAAWWEDGEGLSGPTLALAATTADLFLTADYALGELDEIDPAALVESDEAIGVRTSVLFPSSGSRTTDGDDFENGIGMVSFVYERPVEPESDALHVPLEIGGAFGEAEGYAQLLSGLGYRAELVGGVLDLGAALLAGIGGGGGVDTGSGLLAEGRLTARGRVSREWAIGVDGGYLAAIDGDLDGWTAGLTATWSPRPLEPAAGVAAADLAFAGLAEGDVLFDDWSVQFLAKALDPAGAVAESTGAEQEDDVYLAGIGAERSIWGPVDLSLRAFTAVAGEVGGYHEAEVGLKYEFEALDIVESGSFYVQYHAGLGGGGDTDVGDGLLHLFSGGWRYSPTPELSLGLEFGHFTADSGTFEGASYAATVTWALSRPLRRS